MGRSYLEDLFETMHPYVDGLKFAGGSYALMPRDRVKEIIELAHGYGAYVSTGGWIEHVLRCGAKAVENYLAEAKDLGFDVIELSTGFISLPESDLRGSSAEWRIGAEGKTGTWHSIWGGRSDLCCRTAAEGTRDAQWVIERARACLDAGAHIIMIESERITENVGEWRMDVAARIVSALGIEKIMFGAAGPPVFE